MHIHSWTFLNGLEVIPTWNYKDDTIGRDSIASMTFK